MYDVHCDYIIDIINKLNKISIIKLNKMSVKLPQVPSHYLPRGGGPQTSMVARGPTQS